MTLGPSIDAVLRLGLAFLLALPLGVAQERQSRSRSLRTYPLLSVLACGFLVVAQGAGWAPREQADAFYGVLTGMGFVGSGAIVKSRDEARGMSTAVSLWVSGAIGAGVAYGAAPVSAVLSVATALTLRGRALFAGGRAS